MTEPNKKFVLSLHCNGNNSYLFVNGREELQFKSQSFTSTIKSQLFCIGSFSINCSSLKNPNTGLYGNVFDFAIDYEPLNDVKTIYDIHRYLMKKHNIKMFSLLKKIMILIILSSLTWGYCLFLKNQECKVRKVIVDNNYMIFPYKLVLLDVLEVVIMKIILISRLVYLILLKILLLSLKNLF